METPKSQPKMATVTTPPAADQQSHAASSGLNAKLDGPYWQTGDEAQAAPPDAVGDCLSDVPVSASDKQLMFELQAVVGCLQEPSPHLPSALSGEAEGRE